MMDRRRFMHITAAGTAAAALFAQAGAAGPAVRAREIRGPRRRLLVVEPSRPAQAGVLLLPTIAANTDFIVRIAHELAGIGYTAVAWDPYGGEEAPREMMAQVARSKLIRDDDALRDIRWAVDEMTGPLGVKRVATIGWCLGGRYALLAAGRDARFAAAIAYNPTIYSLTPVPMMGAMTGKRDFPGQTLDEFEVARGIACPVQISRPSNDLTAPAEYARLQEVLYARTAATMMDYHPGADHGFHYKQDTPANRAATALAWPASLTLLGATLG